MVFSRALRNLLRIHFKIHVPSNYQLDHFKLNPSVPTGSHQQFFSTNLICPSIKPSEINQLKSEDSFGQPTPTTHPHILQPGEIVQGITKSELQQRRNALMENIYKFSTNAKSAYKNHVVVIPSSTKKFMSDKIPYVFRQNSDFLYLTGCLEPDSVLVLTINDSEAIRSTLFLRPKDKHAELWDGPRTGVKNAINFFGVDEAYDVSMLKSILHGYLLNGPVILWYDRNSSDLPKVSEIVRTCATEANLNLIESPTVFVHKLRVIKSPAEIKLMQKSCEIASESINDTIRETKPNDSEHHVFARVDYKCRMKNASFLAYPPVVASGRNATTIHYINNTQLVKSGDLILMDAGCEYGGYSSDITRTWPVSGRFTESQRILYEVVLTVQNELIDTLLKTGGNTLDELFDTMCLKLGKYLREIGLLPNNLSNIELAKAAYTFCPHHVSHYLGMDVHDTPLISRSIKLVPGMVCTVEPGIYIALDRLDVPPEFRGIGIRIEDDVLIASDSQVQVLTAKCCREIQSIENLFLR